MCLIGTKVYYFGVGGSVIDFHEFIETKYKELKMEVVKEIKATSSINCR